MKSRDTEVIKPSLRIKPLTRLILVGCSRIEQVPVSIETDLQFTRKGLRLVNVQKNFENLFLVLAAIKVNGFQRKSIKR